MISLSKGTGKKKGETNEEKDFGDFDGYPDSRISLSGCGGAQSSDANGNQESSKQESSDSEEPAEVVFAYMTQNNIPESSELERIQNLINDYTVDKINTKVKLVLFSNSDYMNQVNLMLASGEQLDLFQAYNTSHLKYIQDGTALDITEYLDSDLKETTETLYDGFLAPTTVEGKHMEF